LCRFFFQEGKAVDSILRVQNLSAFFGREKILENVNFEIRRGEFSCLTGANGSGKSTLLSIVAGVNRKASYTKKSVPFENLYPKERAKKIAWLSQTEFSAWDFLAKDVILTGRFPYTNFWGNYSAEDYRIAEKTAAEMKISDIAEKNVSCLSGGEFQKIRICRTLVQGTPFVLLDEPVANLDFSYQEELLSFLKKFAREKNCGILASIHDVNTAARFADKMILLPKLAPCISGIPREIMTEENLFAAYGTRVQICIHPVYNSPMAVFV
jgi:iron complex transport system ATP-binding protein